MIRQQRLAVGLVDLSSSPPRLASINGDQMMYAASLPKIAILLAAYASFDDGSLPETDAMHEDLHEMIQKKDSLPKFRDLPADMGGSGTSAAA